MKVLFLCPSLVGAGVERRVCTLINELTRLEVDVRLGLLREEGEFLSEIPRNRLVFVPVDVRVRKLLSRWSRSPDFANAILGIRQIRKMLDQIKPDVVVSFTLETTIPAYFAVPADSGKRTAWIISEDSNTAKATALTCGSALSTRIVQSLLGKIYRNARYVSCVSKSVAKSVKEIYRVDGGRLDCLANPVDITRVREATRMPSKPACASDYILAVGRLVPVKQFDLLIRAFAEVRKNQSIKLVILGEGPERDHLTSLANVQGLADEVLFHGFMSNPWSAMAHAKLLVLPSSLEGFGNVIAESMAAGCPVIATRCGGPEDIIRHRENGLLVEQGVGELAVAIQLLLSDPELSNRLVRNAWTDVENYRPEKIALGFLAMLQRAVFDQGSSRS